MQIAPIIILIAGYTIGWKQGIIFGIIIAFLGFLLVILDFKDLLPESTIEHNSLSIWLTYLLCIGLFSYFQYLSVTGLDSALKQAKEEIKLREIAQENLKGNEAFLQRVFESSRIPIVIMDVKNFRYVNCNQAAAEIYEFGTIENTIGKSPLNASAPIQYDGTPSALKAAIYIKQAMEEGFSRFEWRHQRPSGEIWDAEVHLMSFTAQNEAYLQFTLLDITERKKAEKAQQILSEQLKANLDYTPIVAIQWYNEEGKVLYWNSASELIYGYSKEYAIGKGINELIYTDEETACFLEILQHISQNGTYYGPFEAVTRKKDGSKCIVLSTVFSFPMGDGTLAYTCMDIDITARKSAENQLRESEEKYRMLYEAFPDIIIVSDLEGNIIYGNEELEKTTGITPAEYKYETRKAKVHPDDYQLIINATEDLLKNDKSHTDIIESRFIDVWGKTHWFSGKIAKLYLNNTLHLQTIVRDVTQSKQAEEELTIYRNHLEKLVKERTLELDSTIQQLNELNTQLTLQKKELQDTILTLHDTQKQLIQSEKMASLGVLTAGIAHEINNPLNFIQGGFIGISEYLSDYAPNHFEHLDSYFHAIETGLKRATNIVSSLTHYSHQNENLQTECDLHAIIDNCLVMLRGKMKQKVELIKEYSNSALIIKGHEGQLHQAFLNILSNAEQAIDESGTITISSALEDSLISISISDTGHGISEENLNRICDPFYTTKAPGKGTGLGLYICYSIIQEHKGTLEFHSKEGMSTRVLVKFPLLNE